MKFSFSALRKTGKAAMCVALCLLLIMPVAVQAAPFSPRTSAPTSSNTYYYGGSNPFTVGQCTWYAYGRVYEMTGTRPKINHGNAGTWWSQNIANSYYDYGTEPALGAIACYTSDPGHVAIVETIENGIAYVSEGNIAGRNFTYGRSATSRSDFRGYIYVCGKPEGGGPGVDDPGSVAVVNFSDAASSLIASAYSVTNTNAVLVTTVTKPAGMPVAAAGMNLYGADGSKLGTANITVDVANEATTFSLSCNVNTAMGINLTPSTVYKYSFFVTINGKTYASSPVSFTTGNPERYTITYDANGGKNPPAPQVKVQFTPAALTTDMPVYEGYVFAGWAESSTASTATYRAGDTYVKEGNVTLYAVWEKINITGISISKSRVTLLAGTTLALTAQLAPAGAAQTVSWESTNPVCATVNSDGIVTALSLGKTIIFARAGTFTASCTVEVCSEETKIESILLSKTEMELKAGETATVNYVITPVDASNVDINWYSTNDKVATVNTEGVITAVDSGTCTVYCLDNNSDISTGCVVTVTKTRLSSFMDFFSFVIKICSFLVNAFTGLIGIFRQ